MEEAIRATNTGIIQYIRNILGTYEPITDPSTGEIITTAAGIDYEYIVGAIIVILGVYFFFKIITLIFR